MLLAFALRDGRLVQESPGTPPGGALFIDLHGPEAPEIAAVAALGIAVPSLEDMEEIEVSSRLYRQDGADYMTVVLPGRSEGERPVVGPVTFILTPDRLVTVRHHDPRPFAGFAERAERTAAGCASAARVFLALMEEIVARLADLLEAVGRALDALAARVFAADTAPDATGLRDILREIGRQGEALGRVRLALLTIERALSFFAQTLGRSGERELDEIVAGLQRDIGALGVHADFLSTRISLTDDATLGLINLEQNATVRIVSVVAVLFLPPTLVASIYGMNFRGMPELGWAWGYPLALGAMVLSALATWAMFKWKGWL